MAHPNKAILEKLRQEMTKLYNKHVSYLLSYDVKLIGVHFTKRYINV